MLAPHLNGLRVLVLLVVGRLTEGKTVSVLIQTGDYNFSRKYFENFTMNFANNSLNMDIIIKRPLTPGFKSQIDFSVSMGNSKHYRSVFAHKIDVCGVLNGIRGNIFKSWFQSMLEHGNFMHNCPVTEGQYFLRNWRLDSQLIPQYLYAGDYRITCHMFYGKFRSRNEDFVAELKVFALLQAN